MGHPTAFLSTPRHEAGYRPVQSRTNDFAEVEQTLGNEERRQQASRCMNCGVPFCNWACPLGNLMPDWQDSLYLGNWKEAYHLLTETNPFPEFTGRICPALCEQSCVLNLEHKPVTVRENERAIIEYAFQEGWVKPQLPKKRTGKRIAVIGSGPAGLAAAHQLNRRGHFVTVFEKAPAIGGLLRYGIPNFKLDKSVLDRRIKLMNSEGVLFISSLEIGQQLAIDVIINGFDAICLAVGSEEPRDLNIKGRSAKGIHFAMELLAGERHKSTFPRLDDATVLVVGGGDTGSDCAGTAIRKGAKKVAQIEIMPKPPEAENSVTPWPYYPNILRTSSSHKEGVTRRWSLATKQFVTKGEQVAGVEVVEVEWTQNGKERPTMRETKNTEVIAADYVFLALGFVHPIHEGLLNQMGVTYDTGGNIQHDRFHTNIDRVYACGDCANGQSLVVRAIESGMKAAEIIHEEFNAN